MTAPRWFLDHQLWGLYERVHDALIELDDNLANVEDE